MATIAGMDLGYGSQIKIVKTNYLVVNNNNATAGQGAVNFLHLVNRYLAAGFTDSSAKHGQPLVCDYIMLDGTMVTDNIYPQIIDATGTTVVPLIGPSQASLAQASNLEGHQNSASDIGVSANGEILAILGCNAVTLVQDESSDSFDAVAAVNLAGLTDDASHISDLQNDLMIGQFAKPQATIDVTGQLAEIAGDTLTAIDLGVAGLMASFVAKGNAAGTTETTLASVTANNDKIGIMQITAMVKTAN